MKNFILFGLIGIAGFALGVTATGITLGWHCAEGDCYMQGEMGGRIIELGTPLKRSTKEEETSE